MSSNANDVSDEFLEFEDWVELFNAGGTPVELGGKYLTDNLSVPNKYALPSGYLAAGDWAFYWLDNDPEEGPLHAPFNIDAESDDLILSVWDTFGWRCVDQIDWATPQLSNTSLGRVTDGAAEWTTFVPNTSTPPTPDAANAGPTGNPCPEDLDGDGAVGVSDVLMVLGEFGCATNCTMDIDGDQSADFAVALPGVTKLKGSNLIL